MRLSRRQLLHGGAKQTLALSIVVRPLAVTAAPWVTISSLLGARSAQAAATKGLVHLKARHLPILAALLPAVLGLAHRDFAARDLGAVWQGVDRMVGVLTVGNRRNFLQLLDLLDIGIVRRIMGLAPPWAEATTDEVLAFCNAWEHSAFGLLRLGYQAVAQALALVWYSAPEAAMAVGYNGPPEDIRVQLSGASPTPGPPLVEAAS